MPPTRQQQRQAMRDQKRRARNILYRQHNIERGINPNSFYRVRYAQAKVEAE
jgi:hypothetical protein